MPHDQPETAPAPIAARTSRRWGRRLATGFAVAVLLTYIGLRWTVELPAPSGEFPVGQTAALLVDGARRDPWTDTAPRELVVYLFYPANQPGRPADYFPHLSQLAGNFEGLDAWLVRLVPVFVSAHASADAAPRDPDAPLSLILFSPGAHTPVFCYRTFLEDLASQGYLVAAVEPTHEGVGQVFPDGRVCPPLANSQAPAFGDEKGVKDHYRRSVQLRAADLSFVIDELARRSSDAGAGAWHGKLIVDRVGTCGHSLGGVAAIEAARRDRRIVAAANLDGHFASFPCLPDENPTAPGAEILVIEDAARPFTDAELARLKTTRAEFEAATARRQVECETHLARTFAAHETLVLPTTQHTNFSDEPFYYPHLRSPEGDPDHQRLDQIRRALRGFYGRLLAPPAGIR